MTTTLRRLFWLALLGGGAYGGWAVWQRRSATDSTPPEWPPLDRADPTASPAPKPAANIAAVPDDPTKWLAPVDDACPDGYPIKANDNSGIYHVPGGRFYERTVPERCYADAAHAEEDGYRAAKA